MGFFTFSKLYEWYQIVLSVSYFYYFCFSRLESLESKQVKLVFLQAVLISVERKHGAATDCIAAFYP